MKNTNRLTIVILVLAFLALTDAWYLAETALNNTVPTCDIAGLNDCAAVAESSFAKVFGIPLGVYGSMFAAVIFMLTALALIFRDHFLYTSIFVLTGLAALGSIGLLFIQAVVLRAFCIYCLLFDGICFALFGVAYVLYKRTRKPVPLG